LQGNRGDLKRHGYAMTRGRRHAACLRHLFSEPACGFFLGNPNLEHGGGSAVKGFLFSKTF